MWAIKKTHKSSTVFDFRLGNMYNNPKLNKFQHIWVLPWERIFRPQYYEILLFLQKKKTKWKGHLWTTSNHLNAHSHPPPTPKKKKPPPRTEAPTPNAPTIIVSLHMHLKQPRMRREACILCMYIYIYIYTHLIYTII